MTVRAIILGLLLGLSISAATYFNDAVIRQNFLIGNHLPVVVFASLLLLLLVLNPLLVGRRRQLEVHDRAGGFRPAELAVIVALGLAACGWPGSNFYRTFSGLVTMPQHWQKTEASWRSAGVLSYLPGGSPRVAPGQVRDWGRFADLLAGEAEAAAADRPDIEAQIAAAMPEAARLALEERTRGGLSIDDRNLLLAAVNDRLIEGETTGPDALYRLAERSERLPAEAAAMLEDHDEALQRAEAADARLSELQPKIDRLRTTLREADPEASAETAEQDREQLNELLREADSFGREAELARTEASTLAARMNRAVLDMVAGDSLVAPPAGEGVLVQGGQGEGFVIDTLLNGRPETDRLGLSELPWSSWWPTIRLWGGMAILLGLASLALAFIVHPQWTHRELLPYPIARFVEEAIQREPGHRLPRVAHNKLFWLGLGVPFCLHLVNGLHVWFPTIPEVPLTLDFNPLKTLFPNARQVDQSYSYFQPAIILSVIAFSFFLTTSVSFTLGISQLLWIAMGAALIANGETLQAKYIGAEKANVLRFGAYVAFALILFYTGRRYYLNVAGSMVGFTRLRETPAYAGVAGWVLLLSAAGSVLLLLTGGLTLMPAIAFVLLMLLIVLVLSRIVAETGLFFIQAWWMPVGILTGLFGIEAIGPTTYLVLAFASVILIGDPREALMPFLVNALRIVDRRGDAEGEAEPAGVSPTRVMPWLALMVVAGFVVAGAATLYLQYNNGLNAQDNWARKHLPSMPMEEAATALKQMASDGTLVASTTAVGFERLSMIRLDGELIGWTIAGFALVIVASIARLRLPWWPIHPVLFLVWGTFPLSKFAFSFLLGWLLKLAVMRSGGAKGYHQLKPLMIGLIGGELLAALLWAAVGAAYFFITNHQPEAIRIFPG